MRIPLDASDQRIAAHFDRLAREETTNHRKADWGSPSNQRLRLEVLLEVGITSGCSLLDVGCATGFLWDLILERKLDVEYTGIDISGEMIRQARERHQNVKFLQTTLEGFMDGGRRYDFVLASGIHYLDTGDNEDRARRLIAAMYDCCRVGMATNFLSRGWSGTFETGVYAYDPGELVRYALTLSPRVVLRHDYMDHDFTLYLLRTPESDDESEDSGRRP